jgi:hypothetical protein
MDDAMKANIREGWQELGFSYDCDDRAGEWLIVGSRAGLARFAALLREYVADPANARLSEHEHYGPYGYLKIMTWTEPGMDEQSIHGTLGDLQRLAELVEAQAAVLKVGDRARIRDDYSATPGHTLILALREDGFDPASLDGNLTPE